MSSQTTQRFVTLAIIVTLTLSVWSGYLYSQTYRLSQDSNLRLIQVEQDVGEMHVLVNEATSKLDTANRIVAEANMRLDEADKTLKEAETLLTDIKNRAIVNITSISVDQEPQVTYLNGETLLMARLRINVSSPSRFPVYYESNIADPKESTINISRTAYNFEELAKVTNAQTSAESPLWNEKPQTLGTDTPEVFLWIALRGFAFQRQGIILTEPKENATVTIGLKIQIIQAHTGLVMDQTVAQLDFELGPQRQKAVRIVE
jgi:hypothetical protein